VVCCLVVHEERAVGEALTKFNILSGQTTDTQIHGQIYVDIDYAELKAGPLF
jgi:hypothetical protein